MNTNSDQIKIKEILHFLVGGGSAVCTDYMVYKLLMLIGMGCNPSKAISFVCGSIVGFIINKLWTFNSKKFRKDEVYKYIALYTCTAIINMVINRLVLSMFSLELFSFLCATGVSTILNFLGQKYFVFKRRID